SWKALAPAIDPHYYPVEILLHISESLPSQDVRITTYNQSARQISIDGEAKSAALVFQFVEKVKKNPDLQTFTFDLPTPPRLLTNDPARAHARLARGWRDFSFVKPFCLELALWHRPPRTDRARATARHAQKT